MSPDEARDRFSDALEDTLSPDERAVFDRTLADDPGLRADFESFCGAVRATRALGLSPTPRPSVDLLAGAQARIRKRRGRFYRDRFAATKQSGRLIPLILAILLLLLLGVTYAGMHYVSVFGRPVPTEQSPSRAPR